MGIRRPSTYSYPPKFTKFEDVDNYTRRLYAELLENDSRGEETTARATDKDLKALIVRPEWYGAKGDGVTDDHVAIESANAVGGNIVFADKTYLVDDNITISSGTTLVFVNGGKFSITSGHTVTINGSVIAGAHQIFDCADDDCVYGLKYSVPEWFGSNTTPGTTDMTNAIQYAVSSLVPGGELSLSPLDYLVSSTITINRRIYFHGTGWRSRIKPSATMLKGAYISAILSGLTLTLVEDTFDGTIGIGDEIIGGAVGTNATIASLASGTADTAGAVYNISTTPISDRTIYAIPQHFAIGGQDVIHVLPSGVVDEDNNNNRGYTFEEFGIGTEDAFPYARNGIYLDFIAGVGLVAVLINRVKIRVLGRYSIFSNEATQLLVQNSELCNVSLNIAGDIMKVINNSIANSNITTPSLYLNCYPGANLFIISKNTFTHWGGREYIYIENAEAGLVLDDNYYEDVSATPHPSGLKYAIFIKTAILPTISNSVFNIRDVVRSRILYFDDVISPSVFHNRFFSFPGRGRVPIFESTAKTMALNFSYDNFMEVFSGTSLNRYEASRTMIGENPFYQPACEIDASSQLTLTAAIEDIYDETLMADRLSNGTWWVQGDGITRGTYLVALISGVIGQVGSKYSLSTSPGELSARPIYIIPKLFIDFGWGTMGVWNLLTLPADGTILPSNVLGISVSGLPSYMKTIDDIVAFAGGASISTPTEGMNVCSPEDIRDGYRPNNYSMVAISGKETTDAFVGLSLRATYEGSLTIRNVPENLDLIYLEGANFRHTLY